MESLNNHILFIGFMGSGKTTVSRRLCSLTNLSLIDMDQRIVALTHRKISQIFAEEGEEGFRRIETAVLKGLASEPRSIISCGGGITSKPENLPILHQLGTVIYLRVPLKEALSRISHPKARPMLNGKRPVEDIYNERLAAYEQTADIIIDTAGLSSYNVAILSKKKLEKRGLL